MIDWFLNHNSEVGLMLFFTLFLTFAFWAYAPGNKKRMNNYAHIPLRESNDVEE